MPPLPIFGVNAYDPRDHGAQCDRCPLGPSPGSSWFFVPPDPVDNPEMVVVLEAPGKTEVDERRPACGKSGKLLDQALADGGGSRSRVTVTNAILCRPPDDGDLDVFLQKTKRDNRRRLRDGRDTYLLPTDACRPRLLREIGAAPFILAMGKYAASALLGEDVGITTISGAPDVWQVPEEAREAAVAQGRKPRSSIPFLATVHPSFVLRFGRYRQHLLNHVRRAVKRSRGVIEWVEPGRIYAPSPVVLHNWLKARRRTGTRVAYDVETTVTGSPSTAALKCIGFGDTRSAVVVPYMSPDPREMAYGEALYRSPADSQRMYRVIQAHLADPDLLKSGWNEGIYDREVVRQRFGVIPPSVRDGILMHRLLYPEVGHSLDYAGRDALDVAAWKRGHAGTDSTDMAELMAYNATDCVVTARLDEILWAEVQRRGLERILPVDHQIQEVCRGLHVNGIWIDQERRAELLREWRERLTRFHREVVTIARNAGFPRALAPGKFSGTDFNPNSVRQVGDLLFDFWGLEPTIETKLGDPSTEDAALREILLGNADPHIRGWVVAFRRLRRAVKVVGTYLEESHAWEADGRVHATWLPHGTGVGRRSCSSPNMQTLPFYLRGMIAAEPGRTLVYADWSQIHLRIIAGEAGDNLLVEQFRTGIDPHKWHAELFYGNEWRASVEELAVVKARVGDAFVSAKDRATGGIDPAMLREMERIDALGQTLDAMRQSSKTSCYCLMYLATLETFFSTMTGVEDGPEGNLIYAAFTMRQARRIYQLFWKAHPSLLQWGEKTVQRWRERGVVADSILGRPCQFLDGEDMNAIVNWPILAAEQSHAIPAILRAVEQVPFGYAGHGTGMVHDGHDSVMFEVPDDDVERVATIVNGAMQSEHKGVPLNSEVKVGRWMDRQKKWKPES